MQTLEKYEGEITVLGRGGSNQLHNSRYCNKVFFVNLYFGSIFLKIVNFTFILCIFVKCY